MNMKAPCSYSTRQNSTWTDSVLAHDLELGRVGEGMDTFQGYQLKDIFDISEEFCLQNHDYVILICARVNTNNPTNRTYDMNIMTS